MLIERLALALEALDETQSLTISRTGSSGFVSESGSNRFVQFVRFGPGLRAESVGERYLDDGDELTAEQLHQLEALGWLPPDEGGNYWAQWAEAPPFQDVAATALQTLQQVHGVEHVEQLDFSGSGPIVSLLDLSSDLGLVARPTCAVCGKSDSVVELIAPGQRPDGWDTWSSDAQDAYSTRFDPGSWHFISRGIVRNSGSGLDISATKAAVIRHAFHEPLLFEAVHGAGLYDDAGFCAECKVPYCKTHWDPDDGSWGTCPHGHCRSFDPHWSRYDYE